MRPVSSSLLGCVALLSVPIALSGCAEPSEGPLKESGDEIRETVLALEKAMHDGIDGVDCEAGLQALGDNDPVFVGSGRLVRTNAGFREACERILAGRVIAEFDADRISAHVLSPDAAYVVREGYYTVVREDIGQEPEGFLVMTSVWQQGDDGWKMVHMHESGRRPDENLPSEIQLPAEALDDYVGRYDVGEGRVIEIVAKDNSLLVQTPDQLVRLFPLARDTFFTKFNSVQSIFPRDSVGQVISVVTGRGGRFNEGVRIER